MDLTVVEAAAVDLTMVEAAAVDETGLGEVVPYDTGRYCMTTSRGLPSAQFAVWPAGLELNAFQVKFMKKHAHASRFSCKMSYRIL